MYLIREEKFFEDIFQPCGDAVPEVTDRENIPLVVKLTLSYILIKTLGAETSYSSKRPILRTDCEASAAASTGHGRALK